MKIAKTTVLISLALAGILVNFILALKTFLSELPRIDTLEEYRPNLITKIYDINNEFIDELFIFAR